MQSAVAPDASQAEVNQALSAEQKIKLLQHMIRIRCFEHESLRQYQRGGRIGGFLHLYNGQEAVAVGAISVCTNDDHFITAYRDHGHALSVGMGMKECMAELFGRRTGCSKGKGGSMHFFAPERNYWGGHGIVAGQTPLGLGLAYALKYRGIPGVALCYLGDGAVNQGVFSECLNLASLFELPIIYVIENNRYSMGTSQERSSAFQEALAKRAEGFAMDWKICAQGHDLYEVRRDSHEVVEKVRWSSKPMIFEISTYRYYGHSVADANAKKYRSSEEIEEQQHLRDPIAVFSGHLQNEGVVDEEAVRRLEKEAKQEAAEAAQFAEESLPPSLDEIFDDVYAEVDAHSPASRHGRHFFNR